MDFQRARDHLLPQHERDPQFRDYLTRLSAVGPANARHRGDRGGAAAACGRLAAGAARWPETAAMAAAGRAHARAVAAVLGPAASATAGCVVACWLAPALLMLPGGSPGANDFTITAITLVVITAVAIIPLLPWHVLAVGLAIELVYILSFQWEISSNSGHSAAHHVFLILLAFLATGIAASNYAAPAQRVPGAPGGRAYRGGADRGPIARATRRECDRRRKNGGGAEPRDQLTARRAAQLDRDAPAGERSPGGRPARDSGNAWRKPAPSCGARSTNRRRGSTTSRAASAASSIWKRRRSSPPT